MKNIFFSLLIGALLVNPVLADEYVEKDYGSIGTGISTSTPSQEEREESAELFNAEELSQNARNLADEGESNTAIIAVAIIIVLAIAGGIFVFQRNRYS